MSNVTLTPIFTVVSGSILNEKWVRVNRAEGEVPFFVAECFNKDDFMGKKTFKDADDAEAFANAWISGE